MAEGQLLIGLLGNSDYALAFSLKREAFGALPAEPIGLHRREGRQGVQRDLWEVKESACSKIEKGSGTVFVSALSQHVYEGEQLKFRPELEKTEKSDCSECAKFRTRVTPAMDRFV